MFTIADSDITKSIIYNNIMPKTKAR